MGVISKVSKRLDVPGEPDQWVEIRMLSWITLDKARKERLAQLVGMRDLVSMYREMASNSAALEEAKNAAAADPLQKYDQLTLLRNGLVAWSYGETVAPEDLEEKTATWAAREILAYTIPGEAETKTPSSLSTGT